MHASKRKSRGWRRLGALSLAILILLALLFGITLPSRAQEDAIPAPLAPPSALAGEPLYLQNCAPCHGETGNGDGPTASSLPMPPTRFADATTMWTLAPSTLFSVTHNGRIEALMPPWGNQMSDLQIWNSVAYAWSLHTSQLEQTSGATIYAQSCAVCHGAAGAGDGPDATQDTPDFTDQAWAIALSQADLRSGWLAAHAEIGSDMLPDQQRAVLEYIRSFSIAPPWIQPNLTGDGAISGTVAQGTEGGASVEGLVATLGAWLGQQNVATLTATLSAEGELGFSQLSTDPSVIYIVSVNNQGVSYSSDLLALSPITPTATGNITIFDATDDPSVLRVDRMNWIVETLPQTLTVGQIYAFGNNSDRTYVGNRSDPNTPAPTVAMAIPAGATNLAFENGILGGRFVQQGDNVYDTLAVAPGVGTRQIILRYDFPFTGTNAAVAQPLLYQTGELNLFVGDQPNLFVEAPPLTAQGTQEIGTGMLYQLLTGDTLAPQTVEVTLDGLPEIGSPEAPQSAPSTPLPPAAPLMPDWIIWIVAGIVALGLVGAIIWSTMRRGQAEDEGIQALHASLIDQIVLLDELHAQGALADEKWMAERTRLKTQILALGDTPDQDGSP